MKPQRFIYAIIVGLAIGSGLVFILLSIRAAIGG